MFDQNFGFYIGLYICGVGVAIFIHKIYFAFHPELKWENMKKDMQAQCADDQDSLHDFEEDDDVFTPLSDKSIKMIIWLSWFAVAIWFVVFCLTVLEIVSNPISRFIRAITDKIV